LYYGKKMSDNQSSRELDDELIKRELGGSINQKLSVKLKAHLARRKKETMDREGNDIESSVRSSPPLRSIRSDDEHQDNRGSVGPDRLQIDSNNDCNSAEECKEEYLDLVQLLSILMIPVFARAAWDHKHGKPVDNQHPHGQGIAGLEDDQQHTSRMSIIDRDNAELAQAEPVNHLAGAVDTTINAAAEAVNSVAGEAVNIITTAVVNNSEEVQSAFEIEQRKKFEEMKIQPEGLIGHVLSLMLKSVKAEEGSVLDKDLLKRILIAQSEYERAEDDELLDEMVEIAKGPENAEMNVEAFFRALASDIKAYDPTCESRVTTTIYDVFGFESWQEKRRHDDQMERGVKVGSGNEPDEENISILPESNHPNPSDDKAPSVANFNRFSFGHASLCSLHCDSLGVLHFVS